MTLGNRIKEIDGGGLDSIKDRLDAIELIEFLEELKRNRSIIVRKKRMICREASIYAG